MQGDYMYVLLWQLKNGHEHPNHHTCYNNHHTCYNNHYTCYTNRNRM